MKKTTIIIDTREQRPLDFSRFDDVRTEVRYIWPGDYSLKAASNFLAIERKFVSDLIQTMQDGYAGFSSTSPKRFDRELKALRGYAMRGYRGFVLVEPDLGFNSDALTQIKSAYYRSAISPSKVLKFVSSIRNRWGVPVVFASNREHAADIVYAECKAMETIRRDFKILEDNFTL